MKPTKEFVCIYNTSIDCFIHTKCETCGWNPEVEAKRKQEILAKMERKKNARI